MSFRTTIAALAVALAAILVALVPTGAAAHGVHAGHAHAAPAKPAGAAVANDEATMRADAATAEVRAQLPIPAGDETNADCGDRGCCSNGHCSGCGTAIAPASWLCFRHAADSLLLNPDASPPAGLAREGPARPPKSLA